MFLSALISADERFELHEFGSVPCCEKTFRFNRRCAAHARRCDRLTIDVIGTIARHEHAGNIRRRAFRADDVTILIRD